MTSEHIPGGRSLRLGAKCSILPLHFRFPRQFALRIFVVLLVHVRGNSPGAHGQFTGAGMEHVAGGTLGCSQFFRDRCVREWIHFGVA